MKDRKIFICLVLLISSVLFSCKWQIPEKVSVKTNAEYNFSAGNINMSLDDKLDVRKMMGSNLPANVKVYDYFPGEKDPNIQRYLIKVALAEIPLDLDSMMAQIDLTSNLKAMGFEQEIKVPNITIPAVEQDLPLPSELSGSGVITLPVAKDFNLGTINLELKEILPASAGIKSCVIGDGSLGVKIEGLNADAKYMVGLSSNGGLTLDNQTGTQDLAISLKNAAIVGGSSSITATVNLLGVTSIDPAKLKIVITPELKKLDSVTVDLGADVKTEINQNVALPKEVTDIVSAITLGKSGFKVTYTNTLPGGNDISLKAKSDFLGLNETTKKLVAGSTNKPVEFMSSGKTVKTTTPIDFTVSVGLPGQLAGGASSEVTIKNIGMGATYKIGMNVEPVLNWTEVSVNPSALNNFAHAGSTDLGIDLNKTLSDLGTNLGNKDLFTRLQIESLPVYVFCGKPAGIDAFNDLKFTATAELKLNNQTLAGGNILNNQTIAPVNSLPNFNVDNVVKDDMSTMTASAKVDLGKAFSSVISTPGALSVNYDVKASGGSGAAINIKKEQLKGVAKIALEAYIDLGLALKVPTGGINIDLSKMEAMKSFVGNDIFQGNGKSMKDQGYDAYMKAIKELSINAGVKSLPYASANPITMNMTSTVGEWNFELGAGKNFNVNLTNDNINKLFEDSVNNPNCEFKIKTMNVVLPAGTFSVPRAKNIDTSLELKLVTDGTIKVWEKGQTPPQGSNSNPSSNGGN